MKILEQMLTENTNEAMQSLQRKVSAQMNFPIHVCVCTYMYVYTDVTVMIQCE